MGGMGVNSAVDCCIPCKYQYGSRIYSEIGLRFTIQYCNDPSLAATICADLLGVLGMS